VHNRRFTGVEPLLWASDYPHPEGTWPHTRETITRIFADVGPSEQAAIVGGTAASLYGFER
jgi:predicted TIM-barrel fold metal-dependent hydrolase